MRFRNLIKKGFWYFTSTLTVLIAFKVYGSGDVDFWEVVLCTPLLLLPVAILIVGMISAFLIFISDKFIKCPKCNKKGGAFNCIDKIKQDRSRYYNEFGTATDKGLAEFGFIDRGNAIYWLKDCFKCTYCDHIWNFLGKEIEQEDQEHKNN